MTVSLQEQKGRRVPDDEWFELRDRGELEPGDYGLVTGERLDDVVAAVVEAVRYCFGRSKVNAELVAQRIEERFKPSAPGGVLEKDTGNTERA